MCRTQHFCFVFFYFELNAAKKKSFKKYRHTHGTRTHTVQLAFCCNAMFPCRILHNKLRANFKTTEIQCLFDAVHES